MIRRVLHSILKPPAGSRIDFGHPLAPTWAALLMEGYGAPYSIHGEAATVSGGATWDDRRRFPLDGSNDAIVWTAQTAALQGLIAKTTDITAVVKGTNGAANNTEGIFSAWDLSDRGWQIAHDNGGSYYAWPKYATSHALAPQSAGEDVHLVGVMRGTTAEIYKNGIIALDNGTPTVTLSASTATSVAAGPLYPDVPGSFLAQFTYEYVLLYDRPLTAIEIAKLYENPYCFMQQAHRRLIFYPSGGPERRWILGTH